MNDIETKERNLKPTQLYPRNGSDLVPAEIQANTSQNDESSVDTPAVSGSMAGNEGWLDNSVVEPEVYPSEYPFSQQQLAYIYRSIATFMLVAALVLLSILESQR